jgi:hypothetical protein
MHLFAMFGWPEIFLVGVVVTAIICWRVFSQSSNEKKDE